MFYILLFILGLLLGSFLNMALYRVPKKESLIKGRSKCDFCKHPLGFLDLIPLFSFIFLRGKCRYCKKPLKKTMPLVELLTALSFVSIYYYANNYYYAPLPFKKYIFILFSLSIALILIYSFFYDIFYYEIPLKPVLAGYLLWAFYSFSNFFYYKKVFIQGLNSSILGKYLLETNFVSQRLFFYFKEHLLYNLEATLFIFLFLLFLHILTKGRGMGFGDVYFAPLLALIAGFPISILFFFTSFVLGSIYGVFSLVFKKSNLKTRVPFGPFLILGFVFSLIFFKIYAIIFI